MYAELLPCSNTHQSLAAMATCRDSTAPIIAGALVPQPTPTSVCHAARSASSLAGHARSRRQPSARGWHRSQGHARTVCQSERHRASTTRSSFSSRIAPTERAQGPKALAAAAESARPHPACPNPAAQPSWPSPARTPAQPEIQLRHGWHEVRERSCCACS